MKTYAKSLMLKKALILFAAVLFCFPRLAPKGLEAIDCPQG